MENYGSSGFGRILNNLSGGVAGDIGLTAGAAAVAVGTVRLVQSAVRETDPEGLSGAERKQMSQDVQTWQAQNGIRNPNGLAPQQLQPYAATAAPDADDYRRAKAPPPTPRGPGF